MEAIAFCYWLQGFMEMQDPKELNCVQTQMIKDHLNLVFDKVTPNLNSMPEGFKKLEIKPDSKRKKITLKSSDKLIPERRNSNHRSLLVC